VFFVFLRLGCTSFGGPVAHLGYFQREFVEQRGWLTADAFGETVALSQSLPGPASSQLGFAIGMMRAGVVGGLAAWLGFTLPSAMLMLAFAFWGDRLQSARGQAVLHGLQLVAVAVVAQAVLAMRRRLAPDVRRMFVAALSAALVLLVPANFATVLAIVLGGVLGRLFLNTGSLLLEDKHHPPLRSLPRYMGAISAGIFAALLTLAILLRSTALSAQSLAAAMYRVGSFVFGGGHVVLPLLAGQVVTRGWLSENTFLVGYGAAQALPGPLFSFAAYVGAMVQPNPHPVLFALTALVGIFMPGLLLMTAALPFWGEARKAPGFRSSLDGVNAATVGVLFAALVRPVLSSSVHSPGDLVLAGTGFMLLALTRMPAWVLVIAVAAVCWLRAAL
jgi:chromate transporter